MPIQNIELPEAYAESKNKDKTLEYLNKAYQRTRTDILVTFENTAEV